MKRYSTSLLLVLLLVSGAFGFVTQDKEVSALISAARFLEQNPLDKKAKDIRRSAVEWVIATDKVSVTMCANFFTHVPEKYKYSGEMLSQYTIGMAAYKLSNPGKDEASAQLAGYESALLSYEAMVKQESKARHNSLDALLAVRTEGTLAQHIAATGCKEKK